MFSCPKQSPGALIVDKTAVHDPACGVVDKGCQGTRGTSSFKPVMGRAVKLDKLTQTGSPFPVRMDVFDFFLFRQPEMSFNHHFPDCFIRKCQMMDFLKFFTGQGRTEVRIVFIDQGNNFFFFSFRNCPVANFTAILMNQAGSSLFFISSEYSLNLPD